MDETRTTPVTSGEPDQAPPTIEVRGLGFALAAAALRTLLDPATRDQAEVVIDLTRLSIQIPADALGDVARRVVPDIGLTLARDELTVRLPDSPMARVALPRAGVRVRVNPEGIRIGGDESTGDA